MIVASAAMFAPALQEQECHEIGQIERVNTSAGLIATWPGNQAFRDHTESSANTAEHCLDL